MTAITIQNSENLSRTNFDDLTDLQNYIALLKPDTDFFLSLEIEKELDRRFAELKSGKVKGIPWEEVKNEFANRFDA